MSSQEQPNTVEPDDYVGEVPDHVAIIMDGNGRWAQQRGQPRLEGRVCFSFSGNEYYLPVTVIYGHL